MRPIVLTIAGSDSSGGAGIQADVKTIEANGGYAATVVTAITAQNTRGLVAIHALDPQIVAAQLDAVLTDLDVRAVKSGMLVNAELIEVAADALRRASSLPFVCDPVLRSGGGEPLLVPAALAVLKRELLPLAALITPNLPEAESLTGRTILTEQDAAAAGRQMIDDGARAVLITGGHLAHGPANDCLVVGDELTVIEGERIEAPHHHGSGCTLASAIATQLARGSELVEAIRAAKRFVSAALRFGLAIGSGTGPVDPSFGLHHRSDECPRGTAGNGGEKKG
jgi:hydroxymethylpyrimidine/phosphomethylpyrimidine kinase